MENLDIIGLVRSMGLTPDQLAALIQANPPRPDAMLERKEETADETL